MVLATKALYSAVFLIYGMAVIIGSTTAQSNTVGTACVDNSTCTGPNEFCQTISWLSPTCATGMCQCLPCYTTGDFSGYTWTSSPCIAIKALNVGDKCTGNYSELVLSTGASCTNGTVTCDSGFTISGSMCLPDGTGLGEGQSCTQDSDCATVLICDSQYYCACPDSYNRYDAPSGTCVPKNIGDPCTADSDCQVSGESWSGFTYSASNCNSKGKCDCANGIVTTTSYLDGVTNVLKNVTICISAGGTVNVTQGNTCNVDPVYDGDTSSDQVCAVNGVCFSCPEDSTWASGLCRKVVGTKPSPTSPTCYTIPTAPTTTSTSATTTKTTTTGTGSAVGNGGSTTTSVVNSSGTASSASSGTGSTTTSSSSAGNAAAASGNKNSATRRASANIAIRISCVIAVCIQFFF